MRGYAFGFKYFKLVIIIKNRVTKPTVKPSFIRTPKSNCQTNSNIFSIINLEAITAKKIAINMTDLKIIRNSMMDEKIISFFENPKILKTKF
jgi:hypothetical protein